MDRRSSTTLISSIAIFISGYTPLFLIMIIKDIQTISWCIYTLPSTFLNVNQLKLPIGLVFKNVNIVCGLLIIALLSLSMLWFVLKNITKKPFDIIIIKAKSRSSEVVNYTIPYMISFVAFDLSKWQDLLSLMLFLSILCLLSIRSQSIFINPILAALGYGLYDVTYKENSNEKECVMLSIKDLAVGDAVKYKKLNNYMGIIHK
ncbi:hypothetical protein [Thorsellia kenyensis]|uniref:Uncharacterized protein n=1 Tax=Thorsellia kenyensis TaxID=1549888 RepID=A0ABV6C971_9GAMM